jgi:hypothetical protein
MLLVARPGAWERRLFDLAKDDPNIEIVAQCDYSVTPIGSAMAQIRCS